MRRLFFSHLEQHGVMSVNLLFIVYQEVSDSYDILAQESQNSCLTLTLGRNEWVGGFNFHYSV